MSRVDGTASDPDHRVSSLMNYGSELLKRVLKRCKKRPSKIMRSQTRKVVIDVLKEVSQNHWVTAMLSVVAYVMQKVDDASTNKEECVQVLRDMCNLTKHIKQLVGHIPEEKLHDVAEFIFERSFFCISRIKSSSFSRFFYSEVDAEKIRNLKSQLTNKYPDLILECLTEVVHRLPIVLPPSQGKYPASAVGIDEAVSKLIGLLAIHADITRRAVVIYEIGGMGKTTLAKAVCSSLDLKDYKFCIIIMKQDCSETDLKVLQQQILNDLFGKRLELRNSEQGQEEISKAFRKTANQLLFLFIDNLHRGSDLAKLLPDDLSCMSKRTRMLVTTRNLDATDMLNRGDIFARLPYRIKSLPAAEAKKLLLKKAFDNPDASFDSSLDIDGLLKVCGGIPLVLDLVGSILRKHVHDLSALNNTIRSLKDSLVRGERELTEKVVDVVYDSLQSDRYKDAFLDIAAFFSRRTDRRWVSYIVGEDELVALEEAALVKISKYGTVELHDVVLARGKKLSESDRITDRQSLTDILKDPQRLEKLKGIWLPWIVDGESAFQLQAEQLDRMRNLRILCLASGTTVSGVCTRKFENLRYLKVGNEDCSPMELNKLPKLAVFEGRITSDRGFCGLPHSLRRLKVYCFESLGLDGNIGNLSHLEELEISQIKYYMKSLPQNFVQLKSLRRLILWNFKELTSLPENFGQLSNLEELDIRESPKLLRLPESFGQLNSLKYFRIRGCRGLQKLSDDFGSLTCVAAIDASGCPVLEGNAVEQMTKLKSLMMLDIKESPMLIERWEEIKEGHPLLVQTEKFRNSMHREDMFKDSMSTALFDRESRFVNVDGVEADWSSTFRPTKHFKKHAVLLTCRDLCSSSNKEACEMVKNKIAELSSEGFHIVYVELMENSERPIGETLHDLSQDISGGTSLGAWIAPDHKWKQLFGFSAYEMVWHWYASQGGVHTFIAHAHIKISQDKPELQCLELKFPEEEEDEDEADEEKSETKFEGDFASQFSNVLNIDRFLDCF